MEKLLNLLNEYEKEKNNYPELYDDRVFEWWRIINRSYDPDAHKYLERYITSKDCDFIERLVKKDKIDFSIMRINPWYELYENMIMYLSVQENPIKYLIAYLK